MDELKLKPITMLGMELIEFTYKGVWGNMAEGEDWATIYDITSSNPGKGEAQECLKLLVEKFKSKRLGGTVALSPAMKHIYQKLGITEYE